MMGWCLVVLVLQDPRASGMGEFYTGLHRIREEGIFGDPGAVIEI